ncbi:MAG TPA: glycerol-3-phosphate acyltransferase [Devosia sp.]|nr:glycerol-3-phosphate acyltransferase [Devosia sp.]
MGTITLPLWLVVLAAILALVGLVDRLLVPSARWFLRGRVNRAIEKLNNRLSLKIQPFKLTRRQGLIDALMFDQEVIRAVEQEAETTGKPREVVMETARAYAREVVPAFSHYTYFKFGTTLARRISQMLYRVRLGNSNDEALANVDPNSTVVFVMNHRSNMDYVLVTYMAASSSALSYAVGEWARIWALQNLIRSMGAYFVRRHSTGNALYRKVLARYVHMATMAGVTQAVFPEGGLSGDGRLRAPKFGLLSYMVGDFDPRGGRDIVFIPVGLNYDRVLEDRLLTSAVTAKEGDKPKFRFSPGIFFGFVGRSVGLALRGNWFRYGYACVSFGKPLSLRTYLEENALDFRGIEKKQRFEEVEKLGQRLMTLVGAAVPVLPTSLVASVLVAAGDRPLSLFEIKTAVFNLISALEEKGAYVHVPRADHDYLVDVGLRMLTLRHLVVQNGEGTFQISPEEKVLVTYYANAIAHLVDPLRAYTLSQSPDKAIR